MADLLVHGGGSVYLLRPHDAAKLLAHLEGVRIECECAKGGN